MNPKHSGHTLTPLVIAIVGALSITPVLAEDLDLSDMDELTAQEEALLEDTPPADDTMTPVVVDDSAPVAIEDDTPAVLDDAPMDDSTMDDSVTETVATPPTPTTAPVATTLPANAPAKTSKDPVKIGVGISATAVGPARGSTMDEVRTQAGDPQQEMAAVGEPPITRWVYNDYTVVFEYDRVVHVVAKRS